ncbi:sensor histidine kinase [Parasphingorhabdus halotolerans]|uniref:Histidine kinase n=1 Tax=Parasphingorhabdus halotolerans TaxID=2725558 RepID=A0A6H2DQU9_9SPHN|nr:histidine kinase [Parasphingorhabdus halotolerans]QJB70046.1 histidine kinase [Parasphingorhabdus halotolerans]
MKKFDIGNPTPSVGHQVAILSILGFWFFYVTVLTLKVAVGDWPAPAEMAARRVVVTILGIGVTYILYLLLRQFEGRPLSTRIITAFTAAIPFAIVIAGINHLVFNVYDPESLFDGKSTEEMRKYMAQDYFALKSIAEDAISRFWLLSSWASLYLALSYASEVRQMERRASRFAQAAQDAELRSLRYQVNPHFLFNTLNSLSTLVMRSQPADAEEMILNLSKFYRTSLSGDPLEDVALSEEVHLQQLYLDIEKVRFPDRLKTKIEIPNVLSDVLVPGLILQPLVENAIKHGVAHSKRPVTISISAAAEYDRLKLIVADDGEAKPSGGSTDQSNGIGLANVRDRLETRFGSEASLTITRPDDGGFVVELTMPLLADVK